MSKNRLKDIRKLRKMTQQELSEFTGLSQAQIARLEAGTSEMSLGQIKLFAKILNCEPWELLPLDMQPKITPEEQEILKALRKVKSSSEVSPTTKAG